jgi:Ni,Fe-hydrogenase III large subunit
MKPGTKNIKQINESIEMIENLTKQYKKRRMTEENYIKGVHEALSRMTSERDYISYLSNIGQI